MRLISNFPLIIVRTIKNAGKCNIRTYLLLFAYLAFWNKRKKTTFAPLRNARAPILWFCYCFLYCWRRHGCASRVKVFLLPNITFKYSSWNSRNTVFLAKIDCCGDFLKVPATKSTHLCAKNLKKLMMKSRENAKKPVFPAFSKIGYCLFASLCRKSEKSNEPISRKAGNR